MQQIEGVENDAVGLNLYGRLKRLEVRTAIAILHDSLTINDCGFAAETGSSANDARIAVAPIISIPAKDARLAALNHHLRAVAIVFDFMNPVLARWRLIDREGKLRLDESETVVCPKHYATRLKKKPRTTTARASSTLSSKERHDDGWGPSPHPNYHLARINQPDMKEAPGERHFHGKGKARSRGGGRA